MSIRDHFSRSLLATSLLVVGWSDDGSASPPAELFPLDAVKVTSGPLAEGIEANRKYLLALEPDRLLAPFLREAGLKPKALSYNNWESSGLDGHTAGHYLSALAMMIAADADTPEGELRRRLGYMLDELERCQDALGTGYIGGVPGGAAMWRDVAAGRIDAHGFGLNGKWVPWYNVHKTFAGLRDAWQIAGMEQGKTLLIDLGDWCLALISDLSERQMQEMLRSEHGGMNEVMADLYEITGRREFLEAARRFDHLAVLNPLMQHRDELTGLHANTQIPKVIGLARRAVLDGDERAAGGARYFWDQVSEERSVAFGGNSVREHFHPLDDFQPLLESEEGPETCNTYNMLRLTERLFQMKPEAGLVDFYERALYNHILSSIHREAPGYVYFTPIRPRHYRVYSEPDDCFWCCVGSGMENPGRYGAFIYAKDAEGLYVNLFVPSELRLSEGVSLRQETDFPFEEKSRLVFELEQPSRFAVRLRHPAWLEGGLEVSLNGEPLKLSSGPSAYATIRREWKDGDVLELALPMQTRVERLPDGSDWGAILHGPVLLAAPAGKGQLTGLRAGPERMAHIASGAKLPMDEAPLLVGSGESMVPRLVPDAGAGPLHFRAEEGIVPAPEGGVPLMPFFDLHDQRYQIYWRLGTREELTEIKARLAEEERLRAARDAATLDRVAPGEQQPEVEHGFKGVETETGIHEGRRWRHGKEFEYTLDSRGEKEVELEVTYWGGDGGRTFDIVVNDTVVATQLLTGDRPDDFFSKAYPIPSRLVEEAPEGRLTVRFVARRWLAGGVYDVRLIKAGSGG